MSPGRFAVLLRALLERGWIFHESIGAVPATGLAAIATAAQVVRSKYQQPVLKVVINSFNERWRIHCAAASRCIGDGADDWPGPGFPIIVRISGFDINAFHTTPVRLFSIITAMGA